MLMLTEEASRTAGGASKVCPECAYARKAVIVAVSLDTWKYIEMGGADADRSIAFPKPKPRMVRPEYVATVDCEGGIEKVTMLVTSTPETTGPELREKSARTVTYASSKAAPSLRSTFLVAYP